LTGTSTTTNIDYFKEKEEDILNIIFPITNIELDYSTTYQRWDAVHHNKQMVIEIKVRGFNYDFFYSVYNGTFLIEQDKYFALLKRAKELNYRPCYVFAYTDYKKGKVGWEDCKINGWSMIDLSQIDEKDLIKTKRLCPKNSINPNSKKIPKDVFLIEQKSLNTYNHKERILNNGRCFH